MSIGSLGIIASVATTPAAQAKAGVDKAKESSDAQQRAAVAHAKSESAAGVGVTDESTQTSDRDADGRRLYEAPPEPPNGDAEAAEETAPTAIDPTGQMGSGLDLSG